MIDDLLKAKRITPEQYDTYMLFQANELGRKVLQGMMEAYFMEEPQDREFRGEGFAFYDGRRSVFRDIRRAILTIEKLLREAEYDHREPTTIEPRQRRR
jgi:hypothetical protein